MIITPWERQAAENFHKILEADRPPAHDEMTPLATVANRVQSLGPGPSMDASARDRLRTRLVAVASVQGIGSEAEEERRQPRLPTRALMPRRAALLSGTLAVLIALSGVGVASNGAVPGDALYSIKRSREAAQLALARSEVSRGQLYLEFARTRLSEAESVQRNYTDLRSALEDMDADTRSAMRELGGAAVQRQDTAPLDLVDDFAAEQRRDLSTLLGALPAKKQNRVLESLTLLEQVSERSSALRDSLACGSDTTGTERSDELGPLPSRCTALPPVKAGGQPVPGVQPRSSEENPDNSDSSGTPTPSASASNGPTGSPTPSTTPLLPSQNADKPTPSPSGTTNGLLGGLTSTVDGVLGGLLGLLGK
ncbi:MAG: hypothetical protein HOQ05_02235 [Corynebacteriales bacterium]|nr:hypothetical protein [Mycobacteriales bacterium]